MATRTKTAAASAPAKEDKKKPRAPVPRKQSTALATTDWEKELAAHAAEASEQLSGTGGGSFISTRGGRFTFQDAELPTPLRVVILGSLRENNYYEGDFDPDNPQSPVCFSVADPNLPASEQEGAMVPHETAPDKQAETCDSCPMNRFGSAERGRGKACKNTVRLAVVSADNLDDVANNEPALMRLPVTSIKGFKGYVDKLSKVLNRPPFGVLTDLDTEPDNKDQYHVTFQMVDPINDRTVGQAILEQRKVALPMLAEPPKPRDDAEEAPRNDKRGGGKRGGADKRRTAPPPRQVGKAAGGKAAGKSKF